MKVKPPFQVHTNPYSGRFRMVWLFAYGLTRPSGFGLPRNTLARIWKYHPSHYYGILEFKGEQDETHYGKA